MKVALYPGAFKPPTKGHLSVVQRLLLGNYSTAKVDRETGKYEKISDSPRMDQVWILVGDMVKGGPDRSKGTSPEVAVDQDISMKLWEVYLKSAGLTGKVKLYRAGEVRSSVNESEVYSFLSEGANPVGDVYGLLKDKYIRDQYKDIEFFPVTGFRPDNPEALKDLKRMDYAKNKYPDLKVITMLDEPQAGEETVSATKLRAAIYARDEKEIAKYAPGDPKDILALFPNTPEGELADSIDEIFSQFLDWDVTNSVEEWTNEGSGGTPIDAVAAIPSKDRAKMEEYLEYYRNLTPSGWNVSMKGMQIIIAMDKYSQGPQSYNNDYDNTPNQPSMDVSESVKSFDFTPFIASIIEYMLDRGMNILPLPDIKLREDQVEASDVFGKTAYYNPTAKEIILFTLNRHPKDILRSFCHEMIHHTQNLEGRLGNISTTNTTEDAHLNNLEAEANLKGTMTFRNWTDSLNEGKKGVDNSMVAVLSKKGHQISLYDFDNKEPLGLINTYGNEVTGIVAKKGYGPLMYELGMANVYPNGLQSDRNGNTEPAAEEVLNKFIEGASPNIKAVKLTPKDKEYRTEYPNGNEIWDVDGFYNYKFYNADTSTLKQLLQKGNELYPNEQSDIISATEEMYDSMVNEANLNGTMTFRNWTDSVVNETAVEENNTTVNEGRYDTLTNQLSRIAFETIKDAYSIGSKGVDTTYVVGPEEEDSDIISNEFEFDFRTTAKFTEDTYEVDGAANPGFDEDGDPTQPLLILKFQIPKNPDWQEVSMDLKDVIRHELEHLTQSGANEKPGKELVDDSHLRDMIDADLLPKANYFKLEKEVDAMLQGLYLKAKKSRTPFRQVIDKYLDLQPVSQEEKESILNLWRKRNKSLNLPKF